MLRKPFSPAPIPNPPPVDVNDLASATECTGLIPAAVQTPEEAQNYTRMYVINRQKTAWEQKKETH